MKTISVWSILALAFSVHAAQLSPDDSFRLSAVEVVNGGGCRVLHLTIEARSAEMMEMHYEHGGVGSIALDPSTKGKIRKGTVMLASMLGSDVCHTVVSLYSSPGSYVSSPASFDIERDTDLASVFEITITNGVYRLDRPLVIGKRNGKTMRLVVGSWNWEQASQGK
jgi:hypothetical protein